MTVLGMGHHCSVAGCKEWGGVSLFKGQQRSHTRYAEFGLVYFGIEKNYAQVWFGGMHTECGAGLESTGQNYFFQWL